MFRLMTGAKIRLYVDHDLAPGQSIALTREQSNYLFAVMRLEAGTQVSLINSRDGEYLADIVVANKKNGILVCQDQVKPMLLPPDLWLVFAPVKKDRTSFIVEKATEMGVREIIPVMTDFTHFDRIRWDKMDLQAIEAAEQCGGTYVPGIEAMEKLSDVLATWPADRQILFCDESKVGQPTSLKDIPADPGAPWAILIGPEGGFSEDERATLQAHPNAHAISLGPRILRADTAVVAALTLWQAQLGDWG
ncbi:16S rRNA (uracil(1498)-N(3))-methyltransferase [Thalassobius sp. I31.1]|uniref:16S rRNA (uracil(1498)-N(3))-methyltransferase n=1 Tax=Thalassobius sp. I31.1 TaxID=2109912 RepID=UPI000D1A4BC2|nr:16S rRNA (uracil(1498)-N(3))-methyltransferase [Thalassobius sp. I31.1]